jgi:drug/metabolite transporter (DMT)-like permease
MSSGGVWFALLDGTPPILKASWRLAVTALLQLPGFVRDLRRHVLVRRRSSSSPPAAADDDVGPRWVASLPLLAATGVVLAVHFGAWSWSVDHTSLAHSLLLVSATPLLIVAWMGGVWAAVQVAGGGGCGGGGSGSGSAGGSGHARYCAWAARTRPPTPLEAAGTLLGCAAAVALALEGGTAVAAAAAADSSSTPAAGAAPATVDGVPVDQPVSLAGDAAALLGAAAMAVYLGVGGRLRSWMPLWLYALPVTAAGAVAAGAFALALEPAVTLTGLGPAALLGWAGSPRRFGLTLAAAAGSGMAGHTLANAALQHVPPLAVSVALLLEPVVGSLMGAAAGVQGLPSAVTLATGPVLLVGAVLTTVGAPPEPPHVAPPAGEDDGGDGHGGRSDGSEEGTDGGGATAPDADAATAAAVVRQWAALRDRLTAWLPGRPAPGAVAL